MPLTRRSFLRALGASAASLPFIGLLERSVFGAETNGVAKRFVGVYHPHGASSPLMLSPDGAFDLTYTDCVLSPFADAATYGRSFEDRITIVEGLDVIDVGGHDACQALLTGGASQNASIDQFLATECGLGAETPHTSLVLAVGARAPSTPDHLSFGVGGNPLPLLNDPQRAFDMLFANLAVGDDPEAMARLELARRRGQSVLDFVKDDIHRLDARLAGPEKIKLEQHLTSLRDIEKRLSASPGSAMGCFAPPTPPEIPSWKLKNGQWADTITDIFIEMIAASMACDLTRFVTLMLNDLQPEYAEEVNVDIAGANHQVLAHTYDGPRDSDSPGDPESWQRLGHLNRYHYGKCARLMQRLDEVGVLDETLMWIGSDMGDPSAHRSRNVPTILAGGAGGAIQMGRRVTLRDDCEGNAWRCDEPDYVPNNRLLVSIARAFGQEIDTFGQPQGGLSNQGDLSELGVA